eukprot:2769346-Karenia_brevis.AAC.1
MATPLSPELDVGATGLLSNIGGPTLACASTLNCRGQGDRAPNKITLILNTINREDLGFFGRDDACQGTVKILIFWERRQVSRDRKDTDFLGATTGVRGP